jgi:hypothetical protein
MMATVAKEHEPFQKLERFPKNVICTAVKTAKIYIPQAIFWIWVAPTAIFYAICSGPGTFLIITLKTKLSATFRKGVFSLKCTPFLILRQYALFSYTSRMYAFP